MSPATFRAAYLPSGKDLDGNRMGMVIEMKDAETYFEWEGAILGLKHQAEDINDIEDRDTKEACWLVWLMRCNDFREKWGDKLVPPDVQAAINSIRVKTFQWERIEFGPADGILNDDFERLNVTD